MPSLLSKYEVTDTTDVLRVEKDSVPVEHFIKSDTIIKDSVEIIPDSISPPVITETEDSVNIIPDSLKIKQIIIKKTVPDKTSYIIIPQKQEGLSQESKPVTRDISDNFLSRIVSGEKEFQRNAVLKTQLNKLTTGQNTKNINPENRNEVSKDLYLGIIFFIVMLFMWIKIFYNKYFAVLFNSLLNYQISLKLLREKSILTKRVSFALNLIYIIVLALFIHKFLEFYQINLFGFSKFEILLFLINVIIIISLARIVLLHITGFLFNSTTVFNEYIHNNYIINKNLGLILFALLFVQVYMSEKITGIFIITGVILIILSHVFRLYRGFQIIIKKDIFLFYLILYLCTLEILPLLLGYKFFMSLI